MANNVVKAPIFRAIASRSYCSHKLSPISGQICEIKTSVLPNKLVVTSVETGSPISRVSVVFKAGSRYETPDNFGITHTLRNSAGLSTKNTTEFAIIRNLQQVGASLICTTDRETIAYTLTGTYEAVKHGSEFLSEIATNQVFKPWEVKDSMPRMKLELASLPPEVRAINLVHKAAFRRGLGNSLFCAEHNVGKITPETLQHYVCQNFTASRAAVIGLGVGHKELETYAKNMCMPEAPEHATPSKYYGGEIRSEKGGDLAYVAVGTEGAKITDKKEMLAFGVLQRALGNGPYVKWGVESNSLLNKAVGKALGDTPFAVSAFNSPYSDSGLFGIFAITPAESANEVLCQAVRVLKSGSITEKDVERAKNQLKMHALLGMESGDTAIEWIGKQAILTGHAMTPEELSQEISSIQASDVKKAAQKVAASKLSMGAVGNLKCVPFLDELK